MKSMFQIKLELSFYNSMLPSTNIMPLILHIMIVIVAKDNMNVLPNGKIGMLLVDRYWTNIAMPVWHRYYHKILSNTCSKGCYMVPQQTRCQYFAITLKQWQGHHEKS